MRGHDIDFDAQQYEHAVDALMRLARTRRLVAVGPPELSESDVLENCRGVAIGLALLFQLDKRVIHPIARALAKSVHPLPSASLALGLGPPS